MTNNNNHKQPEYKGPGHYRTDELEELCWQFKEYLERIIAELDVANAQVRILKQDVEDMRKSTRAQFERCEKCSRLHDSHFTCPHCGHEPNPS